jgi:hypothetical protein
LLRHREGGAARAHRGGGEDEEELEGAGHWRVTVPLG